MLHWGGMLAATFLTVLMPINGLLPPDALGPAILLILALGYFEAGVHLDRPFLWVGLLMACGYVFVLFVGGCTPGLSSGWSWPSPSRRPDFEDACMKPRRDDARGGLTALDDLLQHRVRITVAVLLARHDQLSFSRLKELLGETDGSRARTCGDLRMQVT